MKKIIVAIALVGICSLSFGQSTSPRFATTANGDNTFRKLTNKVQTLVDATGNDTLIVTPSAFNTQAKLTAVDSVSISFVATSAYYGDTYKLLVTGASGTHYVKFVGSKYILGATGNITLTSTKGCFIEFIFDGAKWVEKSRVLQ